MDDLVPGWLLAALHGTELGDNDVRILGFSTKLANVHSNTSRLYTVTVDYKNLESHSNTEHLNLIIKFVGNQDNNFVSHFDFASKEPIMYKDYLPRVNEKVNYKFAPDGFICSIQNGLVLRDLTIDNYTVCNKTKQLDFTHCEKVFVTVAKFHAVSVACHHDDPSLVDIVGEEVIYKPDGPTERQLKQNLDHLLKIFVEFLSEINVSNKLLNFVSRRLSLLGKSIIKICQPRLNGLNVLNHGDLWTNNILFQHDGNGEISDVKFIDYQLSRWTSPVVDLLFFIWTSANEDVRATRQQALFNTYVETLNKELETLGCAERMTLGDLMEEAISSVDWVLGIIALIFPFIIAEHDGGSLQNIYQGKNFRKLAPSIIEHFQGWYDSSIV